MGRSPQAIAQKPDRNPLIIAAFNSVRTEIIERMKMRDQALYIYIAGVGAFFSFTLATQKQMISSCGGASVDYFLMIPLPIFSLIMTLIIIQHHIFIEKLWRYLREDLSKETEVVFWDWSAQPLDHAPSLRLNRTAVQALCLILPVGYELTFLGTSVYVCHLLDMALCLKVAGILLSCTVAVYIAYLHLAAHRFRGRAYKKSSSTPVA
ncbi:hypothetical protein FKO01_25455 [Mesorhizobium sp. B2-3-3]|nr:hypothetical protein FKO01_25455 [Mesorhizobium sp. B2-3-3]